MPYAMPREAMSWKPVLWIIVAVSILGGLILFWKIDRVPLTNWDEGIHSSVTLELFQTGDWLTMKYHDRLYTDKPPLKFWLTAPLFHLFGPTELMARIWSALAGIATGLVVMAWAWGLMASRWQTLLAGLLFFAGRFVFNHVFRTGETDGLIVFFIVFGLYAYWRAWAQPRWLLWTGAMIGLVFMTKPLGGLLPLGIIGLDYLVSRRWRTVPWRTVLAAGGVMLAVALPWHIAITFRHGQEFWSQYLGFHVINRTTQVLYDNQVQWHWYWLIIRHYYFPWSAWLFLALAAAGWQAIKKHSAIDRLLLIWFGLVFITFTFVQTKFAWYIQPLYPASALLLIRLIAISWSQRFNLWLWSGWTASFWLMTYLIPPRFTRSGMLWHLTPYGWLPDSLNQDQLGRVIVATAVTLLASGMLYLFSRQEKWSLMKLTVTAYVLYGLALSYAWHVHQLKNEPVRSNAKSIAETAGNLGVHEIYQVGIQPRSQPALYFYLRREGMKVTEYQDPVFIPNAYIITRDRPLSAALIGRGELIQKNGGLVLLKMGE